MGNGLIVMSIQLEEAGEVVISLDPVPCWNQWLLLSLVWSNAYISDSEMFIPGQY